MNSNRWRPLVLVGVILALLVTACGDNSDDSDAESPGFVGTVDGTNAFIAVVVTNGDTGTNEAAVYVCDGESQISAWFQGPVDDPTEFHLTNNAGASVSLELNDGAFEGTFTGATASTHHVSTTAATGEAGLYRLVGDEARQRELWGGWVIDNDGNERGALLKSGSFLSTPQFSGSVLSFDEADALFGTRTALNLSGIQFSVTRVSRTTGSITLNGISTGGSGGEDR